VIFYAHSAAPEQISDGGDGFAATFGARAHGEDQIAEGKLLGTTQNLRVLVHDVAKDSKLGANVHK
jgi:hypothetical protein